MPIAILASGAPSRAAAWMRVCVRLQHRCAAMAGQDSTPARARTGALGGPSDPGGPLQPPLEPIHQAA